VGLGELKCSLFERVFEPAPVYAWREVHATDKLESRAKRVTVVIETQA
jgi:hypothetical protein